MAQSGRAGNNKHHIWQENTEMEDKYIKSGWHWSFGWLRRKDQDCEHGYCYEEPDGDLIWSGRSDHKKVAFLDCRQDNKTGEKYLCFNKLPTAIQADMEKMRRSVKGK